MYSAVTGQCPEYIKDVVTSVASDPVDSIYDMPPDLTSSFHALAAEADIADFVSPADCDSAPWTLAHSTPQMCGLPKGPLEDRNPQNIPDPRTESVSFVDEKLRTRTDADPRVSVRLRSR